MESRLHSRTFSPEESAELEELVFDLVRERMLKAVGAGGMWTLQFRASTDTDSLFGETIAEYIARDIADQIAAPRVTVELAEASIGNAIEIEDVREDVQPSVEVEIAVESIDWSTAPAPVAAEVIVEVEASVAEQHDEHRMFKPRKAA